MAIIGAFVVPHPPVIIPEIGKGNEKDISATTAAYQRIAKEIAGLAPDTIVIISPHATMYADYFHISPGEEAEGDFGQFGAKGVRIHAFYDSDFVKELEKKADEEGFSAGTMGERDVRLDHGTMVPLYFINQEYTKYRLVRIGISGLSYQEHYILGRLIGDISRQTGKKTVFLASGDLSHRLKESGPYGYKEEGPEYDKRVLSVLSAGNFTDLFWFDERFCNDAAECGHRSFLVMAGVLDRVRTECEVLSYEGPFGVGYGVCSFQVLGTDESRDVLKLYEEEKSRKIEVRRKEEDAYVSLARKSLEYYVRNGLSMKLPASLPDQMYEERAGVFVSIKKNGNLRGCIGTTCPLQLSVAEEIMENAVSAGVKDPRFEPVTEEELPELIYSVDVLTTPHPVSGMEELDARKYGVIVRKGSRKGLLLPDLEGVNSVWEQVAIARSKAGIGETESVELERFEVIRHV